MAFVCDALCRRHQDINGGSRGGALDLLGKKSRWLCEKKPALFPPPRLVPTSLTSPQFIVRSPIYRPCRLTKTQITYYLHLNIVLVSLTSAHFKIENQFSFFAKRIYVILYTKSNIIPIMKGLGLPQPLTALERCNARLCDQNTASQCTAPSWVQIP